MKKYFLALASLFFLFLIACTENRTHNKGENLVVREGFNNGSCFDVKQLELMFRGPLARYHTQTVTTGFDVVRSDSSRVDSLMAYKVFGTQQSTGLNLGLTPPVLSQTGCELVEFRSTGGPTIRFKISKSSIDHLTLAIEKDEASTLPEVRRDALYLTPQAIAYDFTLLERNRLQMITTYKTTNPICNTDQMFTYRVTRLIEWQNTPERFAGTVTMDRDYLTRFRSSLQSTFDVGPTDQVSLSQIRSLATAPVRPDLQYCL